MIFTLVQRIFDSGKCEHTLCIYKLTENGADLWHCDSENALFRKLDVFNLKLRRRELQIHSIRAVDDQYFHEANLLLITNNGSRIYLTTTKESIRPVRAMYAPGSDGIEVLSGVAPHHLH